MTPATRTMLKTEKIPLCGSVFAQKYPFAVQKIPLCGSVLSCKPASVKGGISLKVFKTIKRAFYAERLLGRQRNASPYLPHRISDPRTPETWCRILPEVHPAQDADQGLKIYGRLFGSGQPKKCAPAHAKAKPHILKNHNPQPLQNSAKPDIDTRQELARIAGVSHDTDYCSYQSEGRGWQINNSTCAGFRAEAQGQEGD